MGQDEGPGGIGAILGKESGRSSDLKSQGTSRKDENLAHKKLLEEAEDIEKGQGIRWHNTTVHTRL